MDGSGGHCMEYDCIVIGRGPAGIQAAIYAVRAGLSVGVVGRDAGALAKTELIENYFGFENPISGAALMKAGQAQAARLGVTFYEEEVTSAGWGSAGLYVRFAETTLDAKTVIVATGMPRKKPAIAGIEQFEGNGVSYCAVCDAFFYKQKQVAVVGTGKYAVSEAAELAPFAGQITMLSNGRPFTEPLPDSIPLIEEKIAGISGDEDGRVKAVTFASGSQLMLDGLFIAEGTASALDFATKLGLDVQDNAISIDKQCCTNLPGIFACGDCTGGLLQIAKAVGEGAAAGMSAAAYVKELKGESLQQTQWH